MHIGRDKPLNAEKELSPRRISIESNNKQVFRPEKCFQIFDSALTPFP